MAKLKISAVPTATSLEDNDTFLGLKAGPLNRRFTATLIAEYVKTKLGLKTAATKDVPTGGDATAEQVVLGADTRLSDARTPTAHTHATSDITGLETALGGKASTTDLGIVAEAVATKADATAVASLATTVGTKADADDVTSLASSVDAKAPLVRPLIALTQGATATGGWNGAKVVVTSATPVTITVPAGVAPAGFTVYQRGAGSVTFQAGAGATLHTHFEFQPKLDAINSVAVLEPLEAAGVIGVTGTLAAAEV